MSEVKKAESSYSRQSVIEDLAVILFVSSALFAVSEMSGFYSSSISTLGYPLSSVIPTLMLLFSIVGFLGIYTSSKINVGISVFAVGVELCVLTLIFVMNPAIYLVIPTIILILVLSSTVITGIFALTRLQTTNEELFADFGEKSKAEYAIEVKDLTKRYDLSEEHSVYALRDVKFQIQRGDFISIMGPSGSGKSTLLNCLGALDRPTSGEISINGITISTLDDEGLAGLRNRHIGFIFQSYNLINRSRVGENVEVPALVTSTPPEKRKERAIRLLESVGLKDMYSRRPKTLSGGEQQRVAIARALMNNPTILLADEPTGNLDSKSGAVVMDILRKLNQELGVTIIVVTHDPEVGNLSHRIYYLKDGTNAGIKENVLL